MEGKTLHPTRAFERLGSGVEGERHARVRLLDGSPGSSFVLRLKFKGAGPWSNWHSDTGFFLLGRAITGESSRAADAPSLRGALG
jgi:hypothetical protein